MGLVWYEADAATVALFHCDVHAETVAILHEAVEVEAKPLSK
jgi:hypothetical protein